MTKSKTAYKTINSMSLFLYIFFVILKIKAKHGVLLRLLFYISALKQNLHSLSFKAIEYIMSDILDLIGNTPLVKLKKLPENNKVTIYAKLEGNNPGGSVKDRAAYGMIKGALDRGELKPGVTLIEATSGNTGIALAMIASMFNVPIELVMPEDATRERVLTMQAFGAKVILTPKEQVDGRCNRLYRQPGGKRWLPDAQPVCQRRQSKDALPHHRSGDLARHQRHDYPFCIFYGYHGYYYGHF